MLESALARHLAKNIVTANKGGLNKQCQQSTRKLEFPVKINGVDRRKFCFVALPDWNSGVVVVVYTEPDQETTRIISLRKALSHERKRYEQYLKN